MTKHVLSLLFCCSFQGVLSASGGRADLPRAVCGRAGTKPAGAAGSSHSQRTLPKFVSASPAPELGEILHVAQRSPAQPAAS